MAQIIDGYTLTPNIFAEDIGKHNISMYGSGDYVLSVGECLGYELVSNNEIRIKDGMFLTQGRRGLIKTGTADTCIIENGAQAVKRNDLIVMEYKKDEATLVESHTTKVIKGTPGTTAVDPQIVTGDIQNGAVLHQMPLYRVKIEGLNIVAVEQLFEFGSVAAETVDPMLATKEGFAADALKTKQGFDELNSNFEWWIKNGFLPNPDAQIIYIFNNGIYEEDQNLVHISRTYYSEPSITIENNNLKVQFIRSGTSNTDSYCLNMFNKKLFVGNNSKIEIEYEIVSNNYSDQYAAGRHGNIFFLAPEMEDANISYYKTTNCTHYTKLSNSLGKYTASIDLSGFNSSSCYLCFAQMAYDPVKFSTVINISNIKLTL